MNSELHHSSAANTTTTIVAPPRRYALRARKCKVEPESIPHLNTGDNNSLPASIPSENSLLALKHEEVVTGSTSTSTTDASSSSFPPISAYELKRLQKMHRNAEKLHALGFNSEDKPAVASRRRPPSSSKRTTSTRPKSQQMLLPRRKSSRLTSVPSSSLFSLDGIRPVVDPFSNSPLRDPVTQALLSDDPIPLSSHDEDGVPLVSSTAYLPTPSDDTTDLEVSHWTLTPSDVLKLVPERIFSACFLPSTSSLLYCCGDRSGTIGCWSPPATSSATSLTSTTTSATSSSSSSLVTTRVHMQAVTGLGFDPLGRRPSQLMSCSYDGTVRTVDLSASTPAYHLVHRHQEKAWFTSLTFDHTADCLYVTCEDGSITVLDPRVSATDTASSLGSMVGLHEKKINSLHQHPFNTNLFVTASLDRSVVLFDLRRMTYTRNTAISAAAAEKIASKAILTRLPHDLSVNSASFSPTGNSLVTVCRDNYVHLYDTATLHDVKKDTSLLSSSYSLDKRCKLRHDNNTGRWISKFTVAWDTHHPTLDRFVIGSKLQPRCVEIYSTRQLTSTTAPAIRLSHSELFHSIHSVNTFHPCFNMLACANSSGRVALWR